jgi:flavin-dependent dehydrogenase
MNFRMLFVLLLCCALPGQAADRPNVVVFEPATRLPLAYDVDVVVAGGSLAGVEAALAATGQGATVLLVESRPYLGHDLCASQKLWLDSNETPATALTRKLFRDKRVVTPLKVKRALDHALLEQEVQFLTGTFPAELLVTEDGVPGGLTIVNRSGRQAVRAKVIIDATSDAVLARQSTAGLKPFKPGPKQCRYNVVGGRLRTGTDEMTCRQVPDVLFEPSYPVFEYIATVQLDSDTFRSRSEALNQVRSVVYDSQMVDHSEYLLYLPGNTIIPAVAANQFSPGDMPLGTFRPQGVENLYVLSVYAGVSDSSARQQLQQAPCIFAQVGQRIGVEAAVKASAFNAPGSLNYSGIATGSPGRVVSEVTPSFRFRDCPQLELAGHDLTVLGRWNVVVVGGGTSGAPAALGAARRGAKTLVIEYLDELGGVGTAGLISNYWYGFRRGFTAEIDQHLDVENSWWPNAKAEWLRVELMKNGVEVWFGSFGCGAVMKGNKVTGVVVATPFGRGVVLADVVIDSTGNADVAAAAGASTHYSISTLGDLSVQVAGYPDRGLGQRHNNTAYAMVNDSDALDQWHFLLTARKEGGRSKENPYDMGQLIDTRDRRRVVGDYMLTTEDILTQRTFPDTISHHKSNFDAGALPDAEMFLVKDMKGPVYTCDMPYRCLMAKSVEGLLVTGLGASTHRDAMTLTRMQPDLQNQGYAAGIAAAMAAEKTRGLVREIDLKELQKVLVEKGCLEERVLSDRDSFPMSKEEVRRAVETLHALTIEVHQKRAYDDTLPALALVMSHPKESIPLLKEVYRRVDKPEIRINFARILAVLGDTTGKETLLKAVKDAEDWGEGWDFSSQREHANSFGEVDRLVIALGFLRTPEVHRPLLRKLEALTANSPLSHYKAVCLALRLNKDKSLVQPLARLLNRKGVRGHVQPLGYYAAIGGGKEQLQRHRVNAKGGDLLNAKFKEVLVAALLFECGDHKGQAREILEAYTTDVNGHFAAYAHHVLTQGTAMIDR